MRDRIKSMVIGQDEAIDTICPYIDIFNAGFAAGNRPAGVFFLAGPTGTGKTSTVQAIASVLHGHPNTLLRVDCSEYQNDHEIARLIGAPPGYLGHRETTPVLSLQALNRARSESSNISLILFDEIEKASNAFFNILLGILDYGILKLGDNSSVNFCDSMIFMTSNLGAAETAKLAYGTQVGISDDTKSRDLSPSRIKGIVDAAMRKRMSSEFMNRVDEFIVYKHLSREDSVKIARLKIEQLEVFLRNRMPDGKRVALYFDINELSTFLADTCTDPRYGARWMQRYIQKHIVLPIANIVIKHEAKTEAKIYITAKDNAISVSNACAKHK